jgi:hypothetical protein
MSESPDHSAPEGARCAEHRDRPAQYTCPRCGAYACAECFHPSIQRCRACLDLDPLAAAPKLPWEQRDRPLIARFGATLLSAFSPLRSAPAFAHDDVPSAVRFLWWSALPAVLLAGVIPYTRTLMFEGSFAVRLIGDPSPQAIALDVARAMLAQLVLSGAQLLSLLLPFASLVRAYAPARRHAAVRVLLYRFWLLPASLAVFYAAVWIAPTPDPASLQQAPPLVFILALGARLLGSVLLMMAMGGVARVACGLSPLLATVVVVVPVLLLALVEPLATVGVERALPSMPAQAGDAAPPQ